MTEHAKCKTAGCEPVFQIRGNMGQGDYFGIDTPQRPNHYQEVDMYDEIRNDCRIACRTCGMATPWSVKDLPNMPGVGEQYVESQWAKLTAKRDMRAAIFASVEAEFGADAIQEHLKHSL